MKKTRTRKTLDCLLAVLAVCILATVLIVPIIKERAENKENVSAAAEALLKESEAAKTSSEQTDTAAAGTGTASGEASYESRLFDTSYVHTVDILLTDWDAFVEAAPEEEYVNGSVVIDGEQFDNVAIRAKGNSSLKAATKAENGRYSLKLEFDHYVDGQSYYGLDKLHLNNLAQDTTCIKDYIAYYLMKEMGVPSSGCSYVFVTVNGEDHGLYIALEGIEESFLERNFGEDYGNLLKPDDKHNQVVETDEATDAAEASSEPATAADPAASSEQTGQSSWLKEGQVELATLTYVDDNVDSYTVLFNSAVSEFSDKAKERLIKSIKKLNEKKDLDEAVDVDEIINYMTVQSFLVNYDGYIGSRVHNYYLYVSKDGIMSMLPWDYNLSFGIYGRGMTTSQVVNCPLDNPYGTELGSRPMFDWIVEGYAYREQYHERTLYLVSNYIENGRLEEEIDRICELIYPYLQRDPTKWVTMESFDAGISELKQIIALRGQSLKLQAEGTIPATVAGQEADPDSLVPVGELDISKTGSMSF